MDSKYHELLNLLEPYIICQEETVQRCNLSYLNLNLNVKHIFNPLNESHKSFFDRILKLDALAFGPGQMSMPKWVLFDCAFMPGAVVGFGINSSKLKMNDRKFLGLTDNCFVPLSMYIAIPMANGDSWFGHNLSSLNGKLDLPLSGLGLLTKYYALGVLKIKNLIGVTQWDSDAIYVHLKLSPLKLLSAQVPMHTHDNSFCYSSSNFYSCERVFSRDKNVFEQPWVSIDDDKIEQLKKKVQQRGEVVLLARKGNKFKLSL